MSLQSPTHKATIACAHISYDKLRYCDADQQGHVNNAVFATFLETGRVELLNLPGCKNPDNNTGTGIVIADLNLSYLKPMYYPGYAIIETVITRIGNSSVGLYQRILQNNALVAEASTVIVQIDSATEKSKPLPQSIREFLASFLAPEYAATKG